MHVRENAESIAFYSGDQREAELARTRLARVIATIFGKARGGSKHVLSDWAMRALCHAGQAHVLPKARHASQQ